MQNLAGSNIENIDFLPARFREQSEKRAVNVWRLVAATALLTMIAAGAWMQRCSLARLELEHARVTSNHAVAVARTERMAAANEQLDQVQGQAELAAYLEHPWPRSQVLAALVTPLPEAVELREIRFGRQLSTTQKERSASAAKTNEQANADETQPSDTARLDLKLLRDSVGEVEIVQVVGATSDVAELYDYLSALSKHPLVKSAKIQSIEREERRGRRTNANRPGGSLAKASPRPTESVDPSAATHTKASFRASVVVQKGYGLPGGPQNPIRSMHEPESPATDDPAIAVTKISTDET